MTVNKVKHKKRSLDKVKLPSEVERWAMGLSDQGPQHQQTADIDTEDYDALDDNYMYTMTQEDVDQLKQLNSASSGSILTSPHKISQERFMEVQSILSRIKKSKEPKITFGSDNRVSAEEEEKLFEAKFQKYLEHQAELEAEKKRVRDTRQKSANESGFRFKSVNNGLTRAVPGSLQQNITIERTFYKDLIKLSRQRYLSKLSADFYKRRFVAVQTRKGLMNEKVNIKKIFSFYTDINRGSSKTWGRIIAD